MALWFSQSDVAEHLGKSTVCVHDRVVEWMNEGKTDLYKFAVDTDKRKKYFISEEGYHIIVESFKNSKQGRKFKVPQGLPKATELSFDETEASGSEQNVCGSSAPSKAVELVAPGVAKAQEVEKLREELAAVRKEKEEAEEKARQEELENLRNQIKTLTLQLDDAKTQLEKKDKQIECDRELLKAEKVNALGIVGLMSKILGQNGEVIESVSYLEKPWYQRLGSGRKHKVRSAAELDEKQKALLEEVAQYEKKFKDDTDSSSEELQIVEEPVKAEQTDLCEAVC